jgi:hypothetical protein
MMDQTTAKPTSRFAEALYKFRPRGGFIRAFLIQSALIFVARYLYLLIVQAFAVFPPFNTFSHLFDFISDEVILATVWLFVWVLTKLNAEFPRVLLPKPILSRLDSAPDEENALLMEEAFKQEATYSEKEAALSNKLRVIYAIDARVARLRRRTTIFLLTAGLLLVGASLIVIFAGRLTNLDVSAASNTDKLSTDIADVEFRIARLSEIGQLLAIVRNPETKQDESDRAQRRISDIRYSSPTSSYFPTETSAVTSMTKIEEERLEKLQGLWQTAWTNELSSQHGYSDTRYISYGDNSYWSRPGHHIPRTNIDRTIQIQYSANHVLSVQTRSRSILGWTTIKH